MEKAGGRGGKGCRWAISVPSPQFFCELKTVLKNYLSFKNIKTLGIDTFAFSTSVRIEFQLEITNFVSMTTDDASALLNQKFRFTGILKPETDVSLHVLFHSVIHIKYLHSVSWRRL